MTTDFPGLDPRERRFLIAGPISGLRLALRHLPPDPPPAARRAVLYIHGGTFPSALSIMHRFDGRSWADELCAAGFDVWGFDFHGFGFSDRYPQMSEPAEANPSLLRAEDAAEQVAAAVRFILDQHGAERLSLIAHSWGTMPAARFSIARPDLVERLVLFGPIARRSPSGDATPPPAKAWRLVTVADQWKRFVEDVPKGVAPVLSRRHFDDWAESWLDTDAENRRREPAAVKVPTGPFHDIAHAWHGSFPYDPARIEAPVAIIRGEWDSLIPDGDARWLFDALCAAPMKRDIKIGRATHLMHLEEMRYALHRESIAFLLGNDSPRE
jgi:pimeloyl-ACP methyl ester carboxylesterase